MSNITAPAKPYKLLQLALVLFGAVMLLLYPLAVIWPSGWAWHPGPPHHSDYFMMIVGIYATLGVFLINAARKPAHHLSLIWFAVWSSLVHAMIMAVESFHGDHQMGHLWGDVAALLLAAAILAALVQASGLSWNRNSSTPPESRPAVAPGDRGTGSR